MAFPVGRAASAAKASDQPYIFKLPQTKQLEYFSSASSKNVSRWRVSDVPIATPPRRKREVWFLRDIQYIENWPFFSLIPSSGDTPVTRDHTGSIDKGDGWADGCIKNVYFTGLGDSTWAYCTALLSSKQKITEEERLAFISTFYVHANAML